MLISSCPRYSARWELYHKEHEERQQQVLDGIAHTFEQLAATFQKQLEDDFKTIRDNGPKEPIRLLAEKRLFKFFGTMDSVDKFYRMYLRARGLSERITNTNITAYTAKTYDELEEAMPKPKSPEEARRLAESA